MFQQKTKDARTCLKTWADLVKSLREPEENTSDDRSACGRHRQQRRATRVLCTCLNLINLIISDAEQKWQQQHVQYHLKIKQNCRIVAASAGERQLRFGPSSQRWRHNSGTVSAAARSRRGGPGGRRRWHTGFPGRWSHPPGRQLCRKASLLSACDQNTKWHPFIITSYTEPHADVSLLRLNSEGHFLVLKVSLSLPADATQLSLFSDLHQTLLIGVFFSCHRHAVQSESGSSCYPQSPWTHDCSTSLNPTSWTNGSSKIPLTGTPLRVDYATEMNWA